jgi:hypothetical protein
MSDLEKVERREIKDVYYGLLVHIRPLFSKVSLKDVAVESISALAKNRNTIPHSVARGLFTRIKLLL